MNAERRKTLAKASALIEQAIELVSECDGEEQNAFENLPESLQGSEQASKMEEATTIMQDAICDLENARDNINSLTE